MSRETGGGEGEPGYGCLSQVEESTREYHVMYRSPAYLGTRKVRGPCVPAQVLGGLQPGGARRCSAAIQRGDNSQQHCHV